MCVCVCVCVCVCERMLSCDFEPRKVNFICALSNDFMPCLIVLLKNDIT